MVQLDYLRNYSRGLKGVTEDIKWGNDLCFSIGGKMFLVIGLNVQPVSASFKSNPEEYERLIQQTGFLPAPYFARHHWVLIEDIDLLSQKEWENYILYSYESAFNKLPKRKQSEIKTS